MQTLTGSPTRRSPLPSTERGYRPILVSEKLISPTTMCRGAATAMGWFGCTMGEYSTRDDGRDVGAPFLRDMLKKMRAETGDPKLAGYNQGYLDEFLRGMGVSVPAAEFIFNRLWADIIASLDDQGQKNWITLAGSTARTPANSPIRKYVSEFPHELIMVDYDRGKSAIAFIDPMTPHGTGNYVRWAPEDDFRAFGSHFKEGGNYVAERWPVGKYTRAAITLRKQANLVVQLQKDVQEYKNGWLAADDELKDLISRYNSLNQQYEDCLDNSKLDEAIAALKDIARIASAF
jgi:hypothetical protein